MSIGNALLLDWKELATTASIGIVKGKSTNESVTNLINDLTHTLERRYSNGVTDDKHIGTINTSDELKKFMTDQHEIRLATYNAWKSDVATGASTSRDDLKTMENPHMAGVVLYDTSPGEISLIDNKDECSVFESFANNSRHYLARYIHVIDTFSNDKNMNWNWLNKLDYLVIDPDIRPMSSILPIQELLLPSFIENHWEETVVTARKTRSWIVLDRRWKTLNQILRLVPKNK